MRSPDAGSALPALTPLEIAVGTALGLSMRPALEPSPRADPRLALEEIVLAALRRPPCLVAFSGGRDSSVVLAVAAHVARREGLPPPVAVTHRFPGVTDAEEGEWQEAVVAHLRLADWERLAWTDELDVVGPHARRAVEAAGLYAPANLHFLLPFVDRGRGGSLLSGSGGDELFGLAARPVATRVLYRPLTFRPRDLRGLASGLLPRRVQRWRRRRHLDVEFEWLNPHGNSEFTRQFADWMSFAPLRYDDALCDWLWRSRTTQLGLDVSSRLGALADVEVVHPFEDARFLADFAGLGGPVGTGGRGRTLRALAGDLLPADLLARTSKAGFRDAFVTPRARSAAAAVTRSVGNPFVDDDRLHEAWRAEPISPQSLVLLQQAVLTGAGA